MADIDADIWVCGECRSVNNLRSKQCYACRTPRDVAAVDPSQIEGTGHGRLREIALPEYRPSRRAALLASALLIFLPVMQIVSTVADAILFGRILEDPALLNDPAFGQSVESLVAGSIALATLGVAVLALIGWAFWLSRVVVAMPALGLGYPPTDGLMAFVENFLPGLNLFRVPAIVRDVIRRLDPESIQHEALIFVAWIGLLGGYLVPRFTVYLDLFGSGTLEEAVQETLVVQAIATGMVVIGATFLVVLIWWIERRIVRRHTAQLAGQPAPVAAGSAVAPGPRRGRGRAPRGAVDRGRRRVHRGSAAGRPAPPRCRGPVSSDHGGHGRRVRAPGRARHRPRSARAAPPEMSPAPPPVERGIGRINLGPAARGHPDRSPLAPPGRKRREDDRDAGRRFGTDHTAGTACRRRGPRPGERLRRHRAGNRVVRGTIPGHGSPRGLQGRPRASHAGRTLGA